MKKFVYSIALTLAFYSPCLALNVAQIKTEIRRNIRDDKAPSNVRYTDAYILDYINEAQRDIFNKTWLTEKVTSYVLSPLTTYYNLPTEFIDTKKVYFQATILGSKNLIVLDSVMQRSLYQSMPTWESFNSSPVNYWVSNATSPVATSTVPLRISYLPVPTNTSTGTVTLWYYCQPNDLVNDSDIPFDGRRQLYPYHYSIVYYVVMRLKLIDGIMDEYNEYGKLYAIEVGDILNKLGVNPDYNPGFKIGK